ncbi:MAG: NAD(P)-dependent oxidoreductase [Chloroflexi bacterium]|nr:NAD(P)-dependent oxidoreductase [Chloroflexota bacterium]
MRILISGASGNLGRALIARLKSSNHDLVLTDLIDPAEDDLFAGLPFIALDVQTGVGLERAAAGCDLIVHLPAWHGIHTGQRSEADFWRLNVDGTFWMYQAAAAAGVTRVVFLSSQAWHRHYDKYGFTKRLGEELSEYSRRNHAVSYVAVRPADFTPSQSFLDYGVRLLYGGVDRDDVVDATLASIDYLGQKSAAEPEALVVNAVRRNAFTEADLEGWEADPIGTCARIFPGSRELLENYRLDIGKCPIVVDTGEGANRVGHEPTRDFGTFLEELRLLDESLGLPVVRHLPGPA